MTEAEEILKQAVEWYHTMTGPDNVSPEWISKANEFFITYNNSKVTVNKDDLQKWLDKIKEDRAFRLQVSEDVEVIKAMFVAITTNIDFKSPMKAVAAITKLIMKPEKANTVFDFEKLTAVLNKYNK